MRDMDTLMSNPSDFTVTELKEKLRSLGLPTVGNKAELIGRLMEADVSGLWMQRSVETPKEIREATPAAEAAGTSCGTAETSISEREVALYRQQAELFKKEKELAMRELALARQEIEMLKRFQEVSVSTERTRAADTEQLTATNTPPLPRQKSNIHLVADLLKTYGGELGEYDNWEMQLRLLKSTYHLDDDQVKILIGMKLKGNALEWLHSKPSHVAMPTEELLSQLRGMFRYYPNVLHLRRQFEERMWRRGETFHEYVYQKVILANKVPIDDKEIISYLIQGISDPLLRDQARLHKFKTKEALLEAFEDVMLRGPTFSRGHSDTRNGGRTHSRPGVEKNKEEKRQDTRLCYNCGGANHLGYNCPTRANGAKCFKCNERGHIARNCPKAQVPKEQACVVTEVPRKKYMKEVTLNNNKIIALVDTGSDISLMRADQYIKLGSPQLESKELKFRGIGSDENTTIGVFQANLIIDGNSYTTCIHVVSDALTAYKLLLGTNFLDTVEINIKNGNISIQPIVEIVKINHQLPDIFQIDVADSNEVGVTTMHSVAHQETVKNLIADYRVEKIREVPVKMSILLKDEEPVYQRARRLSPSEREVVNEQIKEWVDEGIVRPSLSEYASPIVLVKKRNGSTRLCVDYRKLNEKVIKDRYPLPLIEDQLDLLQSAKYYSTLDLRNGFFHVLLNEPSRKYTAFITPDGHYEFLRVPFGLCNSPSVFQRYINVAFKDLIREKIVLTYLDDVIIPSIDLETGITNLKRVLQVASETGLEINWEKCCFLQTEVEFLGHIVTDGKISPSKHKTEAVRKFPEPTSVRQLQSFLGLTGYFRKFISHYSLIARPLTDLLKADKKFIFGDCEKNAFLMLKRVLCEKPVLKLYNPSRETELHTDACMYGYGAILVQKDVTDNALHPIYYASGKTTQAEKNYTSYELEVLAIVKALKKFRVYLLGIPFKIITDCRAFTLTMNKKDLCVRVARWALLLQEFNYTIEHRPGTSMRHVDALSRQPLPVCMIVEECRDGLMRRFAKAQCEDVNVKGVMDLANKNEIDGYVVREGVLFKEVQGDLKLVVPKCMTWQVLRDAHERGHFSILKTEAIINKDYWVPSVKKKLKKLIENCVPCILAERKHGKPEGYLRPLEKGEVPLDTYHVDHLGPLPSTKKSYKHILVIVDAFTKFVWLYATKTTNSAEVVGKLQKQSTIFGNPRRIISDRGTAFTSREFETYCNEENIHHILTTTGVPRANGQVERVNRTLISLLTKLSAPKKEEWFKHLEVAQKYLNASVHRSIGTTPFRLLFGVHRRLKEDPHIRELMEEEWIAAFEEDRNELREQASKNIAKIQEENRRNFNKKRTSAKTYREDDLVAIKRVQQGPGQKLANKFLGPYKITKVLRGNRYLVERVGDNEGPWKTSTAADFMKPWVKEESDMSSDDDESDNGD